MKGSIPSSESFAVKVPEKMAGLGRRAKGRYATVCVSAGRGVRKSTIIIIVLMAQSCRRKVSRLGKCRVLRSVSAWHFLRPFFLCFSDRYVSTVRTISRAWSSVSALDSNAVYYDDFLIIFFCFVINFDEQTVLDYI